MPKKKLVKSRNKCKVTFELLKHELPQDIDVQTVSVVGEFNEWQSAATPMPFSRSKKAYWAAVELEPATSYQYRFLINGEHWCNDWSADGYTPNEIDGDNCIVATPGFPVAA